MERDLSYGLGVGWEQIHVQDSSVLGEDFNLQVMERERKHPEKPG